MHISHDDQSADAPFTVMVQQAVDRLEHIPAFLFVWVKVAIALALVMGTMVGWKLMVVTVGEKIGKEHLTYGQGAAAEITAMWTVGAADWFGLPVSTIHVLSSGIAAR